MCSARDDYAALGTAPGFCHHCHTGKCPVGVYDTRCAARIAAGSSRGAKRLRNYLKTLNMELTTIARACGKQDVHHLEKEDLVALDGGVCRPWRGCRLPDLLDSRAGGGAMIVELAQLTIIAGREAEFESAFRTAISAPAGSHGYLAHELRRSIEVA